MTKYVKKEVTSSRSLDCGSVSIRQSASGSAGRPKIAGFEQVLTRLPGKKKRVQFHSENWTVSSRSKSNAAAGGGEAKQKDHLKQHPLRPKKRQSSSMSMASSLGKGGKFDPKGGEQPRNATQMVLSDIIALYAKKRQESLDPSDKLKPVMNNECSQSHPLYNPTTIHKGRIILKPNLEAVHPSIEACRKKKLAKFRMNHNSKILLQKMKDQDEQYFTSVANSQAGSFNEYGLGGRHS